MKKLKNGKRICMWIETEQDEKLLRLADLQLRSKSDVARIIFNKAIDEELKKYEV